jgi:hypothetical protein
MAQGVVYVKLKVWFNDGMAVIAEAIQSIKQHESMLHESERILQQIHVTHHNPNFIGFTLADQVAVEASSISAQDYTDWALGYAAEHGIDCIVVSRFYAAMIERREDFRAIGVELLYSCSPKELAVLDVKAEFYHRLEQAYYGDMVPAWLIWNDDYETQLNDSVATIKTRMVAVPDELKAVCAKPSNRLLGKAFYRFDDHPDPHQQLFFPENKVMRFPDFGLLAHQASIKAGAANNWIVMEYLPGQEFSVDCLAWKGQLVTYVARQKPEGEEEGELIVDNPELRRQLQIIVREFGFSGLFNAKFKLDSEGRCKVLSASPRFSDGLGLSLLCGVNLPWLWLKLHASKGQSIGELPTPQIGRRLFSWSKAVMLPTAGVSEAVGVA